MRVNNKKSAVNKTYFILLSFKAFVCALLLSGTVVANVPPLDDGTLSGIVTDASDGVAPVYPVAVDLINPETGENPLGLGVVNSPDGTYEITQIPPGEWKVLFNAIGSANAYADELYKGVSCDDGVCAMDVLGDVLLLTDGSNVLDVNLERRLALSGRVTNEAGEPFVNVAVEVLDTSGALVEGVTFTDTNGDWIKGLPGPGNYYVRTVGSWTPGYQPEIWEDTPCAYCDVTSDGTEILVTDSDVTGVDFELASLFGENPFNGMTANEIETSVVLAGGEEITIPPGHCEDGVDSATGVHFMRFNFAEIAGRPGHQGLEPLDIQPEPGEREAIAELWGSWASAELRLVNESGGDLGAIAMSSSEIEFAQMYWSGTVDVPGESFRVAVSGVDDKGQDFDISCSYLFMPQTITVAFEGVLHRTGLGPYAMNASVTNNGPSDTFDLTFSNDLGLPVTGSPSQVEIPNGETAQVLVNLDVPDFTSGVLSVTVRAEVQGVGNPVRKNHATTLVRAERFNFISSDGFEGATPWKDQ